MFKTPPQKVLISLAMVGTVLLLSLGWGVFFSLRAVNQTQGLQLTSAATNARLALLTVSPLSKIGFGFIPDFKLWKLSLQVIEKSPKALNKFNSFSKGIFNPSPEQAEKFALVSAELKNLDDSLKQLNANCPQTWFIKHFNSSCQKLELASTTLGSTRLTLNHLFEQPQQYLVLFQNSEEIRATGGFMGSFATIKTDQGAIASFTIEDIYEPDGQFEGFVEAPPGVKEYLSEGKGFRLPDANWHPDFAVSSRMVLSFLAEADRDSFSGVIAITDQVLADIVDIIGEIYLPDYQTTLNAENFTTLARTGRDEFFPGSQQKQHFLSILFNQVQFRLEDLSLDQKLSAIKSLAGNLRQKNILLFTTDSDLEKNWQQLGLAGSVKLQPADLQHTPQLEIPVNVNLPSYIYLVESNVGINKANKKISREVEITPDSKSTTIKVTIYNNNLSSQNATSSANSRYTGANHLHYVNYQRVLLSPDTTVNQITVTGTPLKSWDETTIKNSQNQELKQIGFLVTTGEQSSSIFSLDISSSNLGTNLYIQKQPGLEPVPYTLSASNHETNWLLESDTNLSIISP